MASEQEARPAELALPTLQDLKNQLENVEADIAREQRRLTDPAVRDMWHGQVTQLRKSVQANVEGLQKQAKSLRKAIKNWEELNP